MQTAVMVGCGAMAEGWLRAIEAVNAQDPRVEITGFVDLNAETARARRDGSAFPGAAVGTDLADMLGRLKPDMVFDIVIPPARRGVVETAFDHGCDVLSEKPMGNTLDDARALLAARKARGRLHAVIQNRRHLEGIRRAKAFLDSGAIGPVAEVHCDFFIAPHFGGFRDEMDHVLLLDMAIHTFDAARFVAGVRPERVVCLESNPPHSWYAHGASAMALFDCADGVTMSYRGSWCAEGAPTAWEASWRIVGHKGTLIWDGNTAFRAEVPGPRDGLLADMVPLEVPALSAPLLEGHAGVIADFLAARANGTTPLTDTTDNIQSLAMTFAAIRSAEEGGFVTIERTTDE